jgi:hypothetical protein
VLSVSTISVCCIDREANKFTIHTSLSDGALPEETRVCQGAGLAMRWGCVGRDDALQQLLRQQQPAHKHAQQGCLN